MRGRPAEMLRVEQPRSVRAFLDLAGPYLEAREAEHNLLFGIASTLLANPELFLDAPRFWVVRGAAGKVVGAALQTPPRQLLVSLLADPAAAPALADSIASSAAATDSGIPGLAASPDVARPFVDRWLGLHPGLTARLQMHERIYRLRQVIPPRPAVGRARIATRPHRKLLADWLDAFALEAFGEPMTDAPLYADRWIRQVTGRQMWLWEIDAASGGGSRRRPTVVSFSGVSGPTPHGIRIGPVYTPPEHRRQGYAGNLVAAASAAQLAAGRQFCFLFTDLANPTSNHVYQAIGYEPIADVDQWVFERTAGATSPSG